MEQKQERVKLSDLIEKIETTKCISRAEQTQLNQLARDEKGTVRDSEALSTLTKKIIAGEITVV